MPEKIQACAGVRLVNTFKLLKLNCWKHISGVVLATLSLRVYSPAFSVEKAIVVISS